MTPYTRTRIPIDAGTTFVSEAAVILPYLAEQEPAAGLLPLVAAYARLDAQSMLDVRRNP